MNAKFWAINGIAFLIIISYTVMYFMEGGSGNAFWEASPFQLVFMVAFFYLVGEGKLIQKIILATRLKKDGTAKEFAILDKASHKFDDNILDRFKKN